MAFGPSARPQRLISIGTQRKAPSSRVCQCVLARPPILFCQTPSVCLRGDFNIAVVPSAAPATVVRLELRARACLEGPQAAF